jgi:predicted nucleotidyltransferase
MRDWLRAGAWTIRSTLSHVFPDVVLSRAVALQYEAQTGAPSSTALARGIVEALAYADVFDWPLTAAEIHRYLPVAARLDDVAAALGSGRLARTVQSDGQLHVLAGRGHLVDERRRRTAVSRRLWPLARRYGAALASLPWVRLVAVTGSLAVGAATDDADIDLFIVAEDGRLWLARALTIGVAKVAIRVPSSRGVRLCPNYLLTTSALDLPERDLYTARELAQLVPLFGPNAYQALLEGNSWYRQFLPNHPGHVGPVGELRHRRLRHLAECTLQGRLVRRAERWEMERKIARLHLPSTTGEVRFDATTCKGHFEGYRQTVLAAYERRLAELEGDGTT